MLPTLKYKDGIRKTTQIKLQGYDHNLGAQDGTLWDMQNMTGERYPLLSTRRQRYLVRQLEEPHALYAHDGLYWVDGDGFYADGMRKGTVSKGEKTIVSLGKYLLIFPDKAYYRTDTEEFGSLEASWTGAVTIQDGTYQGEAAAANTIKTTGTPFPFSVNEAVTVSGCEIAENNKTPIIREISEDGKELRFYENTFAQQEWTGTVTVSRDVPDLDYLCVNENRVWGCRGDTIYASCPGNPFVWNSFDGLASDSYAAEVGSAGDFTAAVSYLGYPMFFKEDAIYKVYGNKPSNFEIMASARLGVRKGSSHSLAVAGEKLFYLSRSGVVAYSGGMPESVAHAFGEVSYRDAVAGSDGTRYYVSMHDPDGNWSLFVFDITTGLWHREDGTHALSFAWQDALYLLDSEGGIYSLSRTENAEAEPEGAFESCAEFGDFIENSSDEKGISKVQMRLSMEPGSEITVYVKFDSEEEWRKVSTVQAPKKRSFVLPIIPRRCDHWRIRIEGEGQWILYSLSREFYHGSDLE